MGVAQNGGSESNDPYFSVMGGLQHKWKPQRLTQEATSRVGGGTESRPRIDTPGVHKAQLVLVHNALLLGMGLTPIQINQCSSCINRPQNSPMGHRG